MAPMVPPPRGRKPIPKVDSSRFSKRWHISHDTSPPQSPWIPPSPLHSSRILTHNSPFIATPSSPPPSIPEATTQENTEILDRIHAGIEYTQQQYCLGLPIQQTTRFEIHIKNPSSQTALTLLRRHATLIASSPDYELFELGIPRPDWVKEGDFPGLHDPQWWVGKSAAEIKAGPLADEKDVKKAEANLKGLETKKSKKRGLTEREKEIEWKLREGVRRQEKSGEVRLELEMELEIENGEGGHAIEGEDEVVVVDDSDSEYEE